METAAVPVLDLVLEQATLGVIEWERRKARVWLCTGGKQLQWNVLCRLLSLRGVLPSVQRERGEECKTKQRRSFRISWERSILFVRRLRKFSYFIENHSTRGEICQSFCFLVIWTWCLADKEQSKVPCGRQFEHFGTMVRPPLFPLLCAWLDLLLQPSWSERAVSLKPAQQWDASDRLSMWLHYFESLSCSAHSAGGEHLLRFSASRTITPSPESVQRKMCWFFFFISPTLD